MRGRSLALAAILLSLAAAANAHAGCNIDTNKLAKVIAASPVPADVLLVSSMNRLGFGINAKSNLTPGRIRHLEKTEGRAAAAEVIARALAYSFARATSVDAAAMDEVGEMYRGSYEDGFRGNASKIWNRFLNIGKARGNAAQSDYRSNLIRAAGARKFLSALRAPHYNPGEVLGEFWFNHFSLANEYYTQMDYDLSIRADICGSFYDMLLGTARHPAMMFFLDNAANKAGSINENYGREVIELHTLGTGPVRAYAADGSPIFAYTQAEVFEAARILTGWGAIQTPNGDVGYAFSAARHDKGQKNFNVLFQRSYAGEGEAEGEQFLLDLVQHPLTRRNLCRKLGTALLGRRPTAALLDSCLSAYGERGNLPAMYQAYVEHPEFWGEELTLRGFKTPFEMLVSGLRAMGLADAAQLSDDPEISNQRFYEMHVYSTLNRFGQRLFRMPDPTGYPLGVKAWASSSYINNSMSFSFNASFLARLEYGGKSGLDLERDVRENYKDPRAAFDLVTGKIAPLFPYIAGTSIERSILAALAAGQADRSRADRTELLPVRTVLTQIISSSEFMKK